LLAFALRPLRLLAFALRPLRLLAFAPRPLRLLALALLPLLTAGCDAGPADERDAPATGGERRPNILLLVADDLGYSDLGFLGSEIRTPSLDALAASGMVLTDFHVSPACSPTRAMLLAGVDAHVAGLGTMSGEEDDNQRGQPGYEAVLSDRVVTVARLLQDAGYATMMAGKWHLGGGAATRPERRGFERSFALLPGGASHFADAQGLGAAPAAYVEDGAPVGLPADFFSSDFYTDKLIEYLGEAHDGGRPFFAYLGYTAPHWPLQVTEAYIDRYAGAYDDGWDVLRARRAAGLAAAGIIGPDVGVPDRLPFVPAWQGLAREQQRSEAREMELYAAMVENLDANIGRLFDYLREIGEYDDTLIMFFSDNGAEGNPIMDAEWTWKGYDNSYDNLGRAGSYVAYGAGWAQASTAPFRLFKTFPSQGGIRVPAIVRIPAGAAGVSGPGRVSPGVSGQASPSADGSSRQTPGGGDAGAGAPQTSPQDGSGAGRPARGFSDVFVSVMDVVPTALALAGVEPPAGVYQGRPVARLEGASMLPFLRGEAPAVHPGDYVMGWELFGRRALRQGDWKLLWLWEPYGPGRWQLFDLSRDPAEADDLAASEPDKLREMLALWAEYAARNGVILPSRDTSYALERFE
jgi:arylsulfatase